MEPIKKFNDFVNENQSKPEKSLTEIITEAKQNTLANVLENLIEEFEDAMSGIQVFVDNTMSDDEIPFKSKARLKPYFNKASSDFSAFIKQLELIQKECGDLKMK